MNEHIRFDELDPFDPVIEQLKLLGQLKPSRDSQGLLRNLIAEELIAASIANPDKSTPPWWRRQIAIPLPMAIAACAIWLMPFVWLLAWQSADDRSSELVVNSSASSSPNSYASQSFENRQQSSQEASSYSFHATYLCGVGQIRNATIYSFEEGQK